MHAFAYHPPIPISAQHTRYEEDNFIRLPQKKQPRDSGRDTAKLVDDLTDFSGLEALTRDFDDEVLCLCVCV